MNSFFRQYAPYYRDYIPQFLLAFLGIVLAALSTSAIAYLVKPVLDEIFIKQDAAMLEILPFLVVAAYAGKGGGTYLQAYYIAHIGKDIIRRVKDRFLAHLLRLDLQFFTQQRGGELVSRLVFDTTRIQDAVSSHVANFLRESLTAMGLIAVVIYQSPMLAFYALVVLPLAFYPLSLLAQRMKKISHRVQEKMSDITADLHELFNNVEMVKAHTTESFEQQRLAGQNRSFFELDMRSIRISEAVNPLMELLGALAAAIVIVVGGQQVMDGEMSVGAFFSFMTALFMLYTPIRQISSIYNKFQQALAANERMNALQALTPQVSDGVVELQGGVDSIVFEGVGLHYGAQKALEGVRERIVKGECIALVGSSGSGKSSLVGLVLRFYDPTSGEIWLNDRPLGAYRLESLRQKIAIVTQRIYLFRDSVAANVAYGHAIDESRVERALRLAHAWGFVASLPQGMHTVLEEFGANLSGGQRQRIAIARALYSDPEVLILDEATSALDNESEREITRALEEIRKGRIVILIAHRPSTLKLSDRIWVLEEGRVVCSGSEEELLERCEAYRRLYATQTRESHEA